MNVFGLIELNRRTSCFPLQFVSPSFFCYMQSIRMNNHAGFQISMTSSDCRFVDDQAISDNLNSSANFFTLAVVVICWLLLIFYGCLDRCLRLSVYLFVTSIVVFGYWCSKRKYNQAEMRASPAITIGC